ncbi:sensor histidine kinase [Pedobacter glucosidilyticus]|uniref:sensor histidine kinase n=1 Tax=Pedobacter glucosidilyticus TaxID=1122941 RepID=UPI000427C20F|nr:ATP-binding protein [Pedobacter glucosidilyticus]
MRLIQYLIHPKLNNPLHEDYKKAVIFAYALVVTNVFLIFYLAYFFVFHHQDHIKIATNILGYLGFLIAAIYFRLKSDLSSSLGFFMFICTLPVLVSVYHTGGIYSVDNIWLLLLIVCAYLFTNVTVGNILSGFVVAFMITLYMLDIYQTFPFKAYVVQHTSTHNVFTYIFVIVFLSGLIIAFKKVLEKANHKIQSLKQERIQELEEKIKAKTEELSKLRNELARDFHDEMGNKLASITILSQSVSLRINNPEGHEEEIKQLLHSIEERSMQLYHGTKDFIWSIDFKSDYADELFIYLRDFGEDFFVKLGVSFYSASAIKPEDNLRFKATVSRQLIYIFKEMMTNAAKHANATQIVFKMKELNDGVEIYFSDNGSGFSDHEVCKRGINNINNRIKKIGAILKVSSSLNEGTIFTVWAPLASKD